MDHLVLWRKVDQYKAGTDFARRALHRIRPTLLACIERTLAAAEHA